jgi:hypothetical protein
MCTACGAVGTCAAQHSQCAAMFCCPAQRCGLCSQSSIVFYQGYMEAGYTMLMHQAVGHLRAAYTAWMGVLRGRHLGWRVLAAHQLGHLPALVQHHTQQLSADLSL